MLPVLNCCFDIFAARCLDEGNEGRCWEILSLADDGFQQKPRLRRIIVGASLLQTTKFFESRRSGRSMEV